MLLLEDFWIMLHDLASLLEQEGVPRSARVARVAQAFHAMSPLAQSEVMRSFDLLRAELEALAPLINR